MSHSIFTGLSPNAEWDDVTLAFGLLFRPWRWRRGRAVRFLEEKFEKDFEVKHAVAFDSGRTSLATLLETAGIELGSEVALQAYTCVAVPNSVLWAGLKPLYIDCDSQTLFISADDLRKKITSKTKALIIQYTFGQVGNLEEVLKIARENNLIVIEDCAHVIGGQNEGRLLGTYGDASFFSFGRDKAISGVFGGVALTSDDAWGKRLREKQQSYPLPRRFWTWQQIYHPVVTFKVKFFYDIFGLGKLTFFLARKLHLISKTVESKEKKAERPGFVFSQMPNALAVLALHQYAKLDKLNNHRKKIAASYRESLWERLNCKLLKEDVSIIPLRFLIQVHHPKQLLEIAKKERVYLGDWYGQPIAPQGVDFSRIGYVSGSCPNAEAVALKSVNLPTDIHVKEEERKRIIDIVIRYLETDL